MVERAYLILSPQGMTAARKGDLGAHGEQHQHLPLNHLLLGQVLLDVQVRDEHHPLGIPPHLV